MYWYRNVVAERVVVQKIDGKEQQYIDEPSSNRDSIGSKKEGRPATVELRKVASDRHEKKLNEGQEGATVRFNPTRY